MNKLAEKAIILTTHNVKQAKLLNNEFTMFANIILKFVEINLQILNVWHAKFLNCLSFHLN